MRFYYFRELFAGYQFRAGKILLALILIVSLFFPAEKVSAAANGRRQKSATKSNWKYIVIHHSATKKGSAELFDKYHRSRGMKNGLAYHFVIDNGTSGKRDGQLEIGDRWKKQLPGGHCKQQWVNEAGIGICLVGDFNKKPPTRQQMRTLANLVGELQKRYDIPQKNITGHGKIKGEKSRCPGNKFPWRDFNSALRGLN